MGAEGRKERRKERHRREILDAAREVFSNKVFHRATMEEIAEKADYSPATLYLYFANKEDLYAQVNQTLLQPIADQFEELASRKGLEPEEKIRQAADVLWGAYAKYPYNVMNSLRYQPSHDSENWAAETLQVSSAQNARFSTAMVQIFKEGIEAGCFEDRSPAALSEMFWSLLIGLVLVSERKRFFSSKTKSNKKNWDLALEVYLAGIRKPNDSSSFG